MENSALVQEEALNLLKQIGLEGSAEVEEQEEGFSVTVDSGENALLIGKHGSTLSSFEYLLALIVAQKTGEFKRVTVEIGGYRKDREQYLEDLAYRLKDEVVASGGEKTIRGLKPWERRHIHLMFAEDSEITTESTGEERDRTLVLKKK